MILAAGAIKSPQLLHAVRDRRRRRSCRRHGIAPRLDLPGVGEGLQDHLQVKLIYKVEGVTTLNQVFNSWPRRAAEALKYALRGQGALASGPSMCGGFARSDPALDLPDLQLHFNPLSGDRPGHLHDFPACSADRLPAPAREPRPALADARPIPRDQPAMVANYLAERRTTGAWPIAGMRLTQRHHGVSPPCGA